MRTTAITIPQYAKSTDPRVIDAISRNREGLAAFHAEATAFASAHGSPLGAYYPSSFAGSHAIRAIGGDTKPTTGRWKAGHRGYGWLPYKNNPIYAELDAIIFQEEAIPGIPDLVYAAPFPDGGQYLATPSPFVHDGTAYLGFSFVPYESEMSSDHLEAEWVEILASEFHAAREAHTAERNA